MIQSAVAFLAVLLVWRIVRVAFSRSPLDKVPGPPSASFLAGNLSQILDRQGWAFHTELIERYGSIVKVHGVFGAQWLYISDPLALSHVLKNPKVYDELPWYLESNSMMLGPGILSVNGDVHRRQRKIITPVFSSKHLRELLPVFYRVTEKLMDAISSRVQANVTDLDILGWMGRAALELIGQSGIGYSFDPLTEDTADEFAEATKSFVPVSTCSEMMLFRQATPIFKYLGPARFRRWLLERLPIRSVQKIIWVCDTLHKRSSEIFRAKKAAVLAGEDAHAKDLISVLLKANMAASAQDRLPDDQLLGQMSSIIFAAMDTTSNAMSRILQLLAQNPDVQDKLRKEIINAKADTDGHLDYDRLQSLPYLDAVCRETLRLYAPAPLTFRGTTQDTVLPLSQPIRRTDGTYITQLVVPRGTNILIGIMGCNRSKVLWGEDAYEWKPERWLNPLPQTVEKAAIPGVYSHLMTFLGGGRSCIGFTLSQLEMKVVLSELLSKFAFELSDKPIIWNIAGVTYPSTSIEGTKSEMWLKVRRLCHD